MADTDIKKDDKKPEDKSSEKEAVNKKADPKSTIVRVNKSTEIDLAKELPEYSNDYLRCYAATHNGRSCFAMMADEHYAPRVSLFDNYKLVSSNNTATLIDYGVGYNADDLPVGYFILYLDSLGQRIYKNDDIIALGWKSDHVLEKLVMPTIQTLKDLQSRDISHGNIRASNLYNGGNKNFDVMKLGECLSLPSSLAQPIVYETIERGMADPIGRGNALISDDLYALGVLMAMHLRSYDPLKGKTENEIISAKVVNGSYAALVGGNDRFSGGVLELLRGLLMDDAKQRWTLDEVLAWMDGRRLSPKQPAKMKKATRAINLNGTAYYYATTFAHNISANAQETVTMVENNELAHWVERSLGDEDMSLRLSNAVKTASDGGVGAGYWDRLIPRLSIALDPNAPIRFKNNSFFMDGYGAVFANAFVQKSALSKLISFLTDTISLYWITECANLNMDVSHYASQIDKARQFLKSNTIFTGAERCLYFFNDSIHCLSPIVKDYYCRTPVEYIAALEHFANLNKNSLPDKIIDQHAACFLIERDNRVVEPYSYDLNSPERFRYILANIQILGAIQKFSNVGKLPHITEWLVQYIEPLIDRFHSGRLKKKIRAELQAKKTSGEIKDIMDIIEDPKIIRDDQLDFRAALKEYRALTIERTQLELKLKNPRFNAEKTGREWAMTISGVISTLIILGFVMVHFGTESPF
jgi:hypothetical protein